MKTISIKTRILVPSAAVLVMLFISFLAGVWFLLSTDVEEDCDNKLSSCKRFFKKELKEDVQVIASATEILAQDETLKKLWKEHDRDALLRYTAPILSNLEKSYKITHLYFIEPDQTTFLRVHQPERYGDFIDRATMRKAVETQQVASGPEIGILGTFALRLVQPWYIDDRLAGYIEVAEEISNITSKLQEVAGVEIVVLIDKKCLDKAGLAEGKGTPWRTLCWNIMPQEAVLYRHPNDLPDRLIAAIKSADLSDSKQAAVNLSRDKQYRAAAFPLYDAEGSKVGRIVIFKNTTVDMVSASSIEYMLAGMFYLSAMLLLGLGYWYLGRIEKQLDRSAQQRIQTENDLRKQAAELRENNIALEEARAAAQAATMAKSEFLANMSHEIRTPMTAIMGFLETLSDSEQNQQERATAIETIRRNGQYLLQLITEILDLSKIEMGKMVIRPYKCSVPQILGDILSLMQFRAKAKGLSIFVQNQGPVPESISTDSTRLRQILINLVGNAIKFTEVGEVRIVAGLGNEQDRSMLNIDVIDTGIGIEQDQLEQVFKPFTQADETATRKYGGTGLGLAICQRLAGVLGGRISVKSTPGKGSAFRLSIPTGPLAVAAMIDNLGDYIKEKHSPDGESRNVQAASIKHITGRILLVEDGPDNQKLISFILRKAAADVTIADNGRMAVDYVWQAIADSAAFDLILMDMQMPVLDGYAATRELRSKGYDGPIIALTAHAMVEDREKCLVAGCNHYLSKPIKRETLLETAAEFLPQPVGY